MLKTAILVCLFSAPGHTKPVAHNLEINLVDAREILSDNETDPAEIVKWHAGYHCEREFGEPAVGAYLKNISDIQARLKAVSHE